MPSGVAQELSWLLRVAAAPRAARANLYAQWEEISPLFSETDETRQIPACRYLMDVFNQGRVPNLLAALQQLRAQGISPTLDEFVDIVQTLVERPWTFSQPDLNIISYLNEYPSASAVQISRATGYHRQTVASRLRKLIFALQVYPYPLINYHALKLRRLQFWYRSNVKTPTSVYFYSRFSHGGAQEGGWLVDTWSCPMGAEDTLTAHYRHEEAKGQIQQLKVCELLTIGKHTSIAAYEPNIGWWSDPAIMKLTLRRALQGQDVFTPAFLEQMVYHPINVPRLDATDIHLIGALLDGYLLGRSKEELAIQLGISRSTLSRRLALLEASGTVKPILWIKTENLVHTTLHIPLSQPQVLNALMCAPLVYFYQLETLATGEREWLVSVQSSPAIAEVITNCHWPDGSPLHSYWTHILSSRRPRELFASYDAQRNGWPVELLIPQEDSLTS